MNPTFYHRIYRPLAPHLANFTANAYAFWALSNGITPSLEAPATFIAGTWLASAWEAEEALPRAKPGANRLERITNVGTGGVVSAALGAATGIAIGRLTRY